MKWYFIASLPNDSQSTYEGREEWNQHIGLSEKSQALVGSWAKISSVAEGTKWTCVGD